MSNQKKGVDFFAQKFKEVQDQFFKDGNETVSIKKISGFVDEDKKTTDFVPFFEGQSGHVYKIRTVDEGIPINRWNAYEKLSVMFGYNATLQQLHANNKKTEDILTDIICGNGKYTSKHLIQHTAQITKGIFETASDKFSKALYFCTIFIIRDDEDIKDWSKDMAEKKLEDWAESKIDVNDFFLLARSFSMAWQKQLKGEQNG